jgi:hypothetical protein
VPITAACSLATCRRRITSIPLLREQWQVRSPAFPGAAHGETLKKLAQRCLSPSAPTSSGPRLMRHGTGHEPTEAQIQAVEEELKDRACRPLDDANLRNLTRSPPLDTTSSRLRSAPPASASSSRSTRTSCSRYTFSTANPTQASAHIRQHPGTGHPAHGHALPPHHG